MIPQHEPLRTPEKWSGQERSLVIQLERVIDDIYRNLALLKREVDDLRQQIGG
jgi:hypothetical protein